ncbi:MAG: hypothetical protein Q8O67_00380 [Deltaproteobacteria bacterium]|nr:hypothetical protein [Deltaproteobacteria bacterium]
MATLREVLLELKLVDAADLEALEAWAPYRGLSLVERIYRAGVVPDQKLVSAFTVLGATDGTTHVLAGLPPPAALGAFNRALAEKHRALPLSVDKRRLVVALLDPADVNTIEKLTFSCGLIIEPRSCRPRALFEAMARAYDLPVIRPDGAFLESRRSLQRAGGDDAGFDLPPPSIEAAARFFGNRRAADAGSPIANALLEAVDGIDVNLDDEPPRRSLLEAGSARDLRPARTPLIDPRTLDDVARNPPRDLLAARDSLPPQILRLLVPPLRTCALFLVRKNVAVGWDVKTDDDAISTGDIRDVLLPLSAPSVLSEAVVVRRASHGNPRDPTIMERTLFRFMRRPPPRAFSALPVLTGDDVIAVLYLDRNGPIDDALVDEVRRAGAALGDALAPLAAAGALFPALSWPPARASI